MAGSAAFIPRPSGLSVRCHKVKSASSRPLVRRTLVVPPARSTATAFVPPPSPGVVPQYPEVAHFTDAFQQVAADAVAPPAGQDVEGLELSADRRCESRRARCVHGEKIKASSEGWQEDARSWCTGWPIGAAIDMRSSHST